MTIRREDKLRFRRSGEIALSLEPEVAVRLRERGTNDDRRFDVYYSSHIVIAHRLLVELLRIRRTQIVTISWMSIEAVLSLMVCVESE
jgi:hypothetical protein